MNANQLLYATQFAAYSPEDIEAAVILALALNVYVKHRETSEEVRSHFFDVVSKTDSILFDLNEVRAFNVDHVKLMAYEVFKVRYQHTVFPKASQVLLADNEIHNTYLRCVKSIPPQPAVDALFVRFQQRIRDAYSKGGV